MVEIGDKAPNFSLPSTIGDKVSLSDYLGKKNVVVAFYCLNWTPGCTNEMCGFRDNLSKFKDANSELLAISVDSQFADKTWSKELNLNFPVLSDFNKDVTRAYGVLHGDTGFFKEKLNLVGVSKRSIFIVDKQGVVRYKWITEDPTQLPSQDVILAELGKLK